MECASHGMNFKRAHLTAAEWQFVSASVGLPVYLKVCDYAQGTVCSVCIHVYVCVKMLKEYETAITGIIHSP